MDRELLSTLLVIHPLEMKVHGDADPQQVRRVTQEQG